MKSTTRVTAGALLAAAVGLTGLAPAQAVDPLIEVSPAELHIAVPAPGHSGLLSATVENVYSAPVQVVARLEADPADPFVADGSPLTLAISVDGTAVSGARPIAEVAAEPVQVTTLAPGETSTIEATVLMDAAADNSWAGRSTEMTLQVVGQADDHLQAPGPSTGGPLATTGASIAGAAGLAVLAALVGTALVRRKTSTQTRSGR